MNSHAVLEALLEPERQVGADSDFERIGTPPPAQHERDGHRDDRPRRWQAATADRAMAAAGPPAPRPWQAEPRRQRPPKPWSMSTCRRLARVSAATARAQPVPGGPRARRRRIQRVGRAGRLAHDVTAALDAGAIVGTSPCRAARAQQAMQSECRQHAEPRVRGQEGYLRQRVDRRPGGHALTERAGCERHVAHGARTTDGHVHDKQ